MIIPLNPPFSKGEISLPSPPLEKGGKGDLIKDFQMKCKASNVRIIGLMSGTSHDGVDAALVEIIHNPPTSPLEKGGIPIRLLSHLHIPYRKPLRDEIRQAFNGSTELICRLNFKLGEIFAGAVLSLLKATGFRAEDIDAIASHGQTIYHIPPAFPPPLQAPPPRSARA